MTSHTGNDVSSKFPNYGLLVSVQDLFSSVLCIVHKLNAFFTLVYNVTTDCQLPPLVLNWKWCLCSIVRLRLSIRNVRTVAAFPNLWTECRSFIQIKLWMRTDGFSVQIVIFSVITWPVSSSKLYHFPSSGVSLLSDSVSSTMSVPAGELVS